MENRFPQPICSLAGRYENPYHNRVLIPIDCSKIPALLGNRVGWRGGGGSRINLSLPKHTKALLRK
jgi:hypothetical protein